MLILNVCNTVNISRLMNSLQSAVIFTICVLYKNCYWFVCELRSDNF